MKKSGSAIVREGERRFREEMAAPEAKGLPQNNIYFLLYFRAWT